MSNLSPALQTPSQESFLEVALKTSCTAGFIAIVFYLFMPPIGTFKILALLAYGLLVVITFLKTLPYRLRAGGLLLLLYFAGIFSLMSFEMPEATVFFLSSVAMTGLLFPSKSGIYYAIGITLLSILGIAWLNSLLQNWGWFAGVFLFASTMVGLGLHRFQQEFIYTQAAAGKMLITIQEEQSTLEQRVEERTARLTRKSEQLRAIAYVARKIAEIEDLNVLLSAITELVIDQFQLYHAGIFLLNETGDRVVLQAASSEGGRRMIERGYSILIGAPGVIGYVAAQKKPLIAFDVGKEAVTFNNPDLPMTRSQIALPLAARNKLIGILDIQSDEPQAFHIDDNETLQILADQIAIAIDNAHLIDEAQAAIKQLEMLTSTRTREAWRRKLREKDRIFTYTPLGLRAEKIPQSDDKAIIAPIMLRGQKIGTISIARKSNGAWSKLDKDMVDEVAGQVGLAVDNIRLLEDATRRARQEQTVGKLAARFSESLDLDALLQTAARELGQLPDVSEVSVVISPEMEQSSASRQRLKRTTS